MWICFTTLVWSIFWWFRIKVTVKMKEAKNTNAVYTTYSSVLFIYSHFPLKQSLWILQPCAVYCNILKLLRVFLCPWTCYDEIGLCCGLLLVFLMVVSSDSLHWNVWTAPLLHSWIFRYVVCSISLSLVVFFYAF